MKLSINMADVEGAFDQVMTDLAEQVDALRAITRYGTAATAEHLGGEHTEELVRQACLVVLCSLEADAIRARVTAGISLPDAEGVENDPTTAATEALGPAGVIGETATEDDQRGG